VTRHCVVSETISLLYTPPPSLGNTCSPCSHHRMSVRQPNPNGICCCGNSCAYPTPRGEKCTPCSPVGSTSGPKVPIYKWQHHCIAPAAAAAACWLLLALVQLQQQELCLRGQCVQGAAPLRGHPPQLVACTRKVTLEVQLRRADVVSTQGMVSYRTGQLQEGQTTGSSTTAAAAVPRHNK
jgi:hypothetical protein